jgi:protein-S-isoprenylcysteine O-methyltransferase Ste14
MQIGAVLRESRAFPARVFQKGGKAYDLLAAAPLIVWYVLSASDTVRVLREKSSQMLLRPELTLGLTIVAKFALFLFALALIAFLIARQPPKNAAKGLAPRLASLLGTYLIVAIVSVTQPYVPGALLAASAFLILGGMAFALYSILWLGRSFSLMAEARELVVTGPYAYVRHPLYVGEELAIVGAALQHLSPLAISLLAVQICCQLYRMKCEETVLQDAFPAYAAYKTRTARLIPGVY